MITMAYLGEEIKKLGFGLMRLPQKSEGVIDVEQTKVMVDKFLEAGFRQRGCHSRSLGRTLSERKISAGNQDGCMDQLQDKR